MLVVSHIQPECYDRDAKFRNLGGDASSLVHVSPTAENADLYTMDLPEYTHLATSGEISVDAEATRNEKTQVSDQSPAYDAGPGQPLQLQISDRQSEEQGLSGEYEYHIQQDIRGQENSSEIRTAAPVITHHLTEPVATASLASVRACSILNDRPAVWLVKRKSMALSPLAAAVLTKEGLVQAKDLQL